MTRRIWTAVVAAAALGLVGCGSPEEDRPAICQDASEAVAAIAEGGEGWGVEQVVESGAVTNRGGEGYVVGVRIQYGEDDESVGTWQVGGLTTAEGVGPILAGDEVSELVGSWPRGVLDSGDGGVQRAMECAGG